MVKLNVEACIPGLVCINRNCVLLLEVPVIHIGKGSLI